MKIKKKTLLKIIISIILFGLIFARVDIAQIIQNIQMMNPFYLFIILLFLVLNYLISSVRWRVLILSENKEDVSVPYLTSLYFIGAFFNNFMPTSMGGDVYKIYKLGKRLSNTAAAFSATFMERFTGFVALIIISYAGFVQTLDFWLSYVPPQILENNIFYYGFYFAVFFGFWFAALMGFSALKIASTKVSKVKKVYESLLEYKGKWKVLGVAVITSFIVQLLAIFTQYFVFLGLGVELPLTYALFVFPVVTLAAFFIPSINGIGVQDFLYIELFSSVGVSTEMALSASIIYHLSRLLISLVGGVFYALGKAD